jgi:hypothetical protein
LHAFRRKAAQSRENIPVQDLELFHCLLFLGGLNDARRRIRVNYD